MSTWHRGRAGGDRHGDNMTEGEDMGGGDKGGGSKGEEETQVRGKWRETDGSGRKGEGREDRWVGGGRKRDE